MSSSSSFDRGPWEPSLVAQKHRNAANVALSADSPLSSPFSGNRSCRVPLGRKEHGTQHRAVAPGTWTSVDQSMVPVLTAERDGGSGGVRKLTWKEPERTISGAPALPPPPYPTPVPVATSASTSLAACCAPCSALKTRCDTCRRPRGAGATPVARKGGAPGVEAGEVDYISSYISFSTHLLAPPSKSVISTARRRTGPPNAPQQRHGLWRFAGSQDQPGVAQGHRATVSRGPVQPAFHSKRG